MGFFSSSRKLQLPWVSIESVSQLDEILQNTGELPIVLFKHSTRCSISTMVLNNFEQNWSLSEEACTLYYIDLLKFRDVSNRIEELTGIMHQSPQVIVIAEKEIIYDATHSSIDAKRIESAIKKL